MSVRDLQEKLGMKRGGRDLVNRAIRALLPGGNECLDGLAVLHELQHRLIRDGRPEADVAIAQIGRDRLADVADAMEKEIRKRYDMPAK